MSRRWIVRVRLAVTVILVAGVVVAFVSATSRAREVQWPSWPAVAASIALVSATLLAGAGSWIAMFPGNTNRAALARAFLVGQLGKYVPGGVLQVASVVDLSRRAGVGGRDVAVAVPVHALTGIVAPGMVAVTAFGAVDGRLPGFVRLAVAAGGVAVAVLIVRRRWLAALLDVAHRRWRRLPDGSHVPAGRSLVRAACFGFVGFVAYGSAFAVLLAPPGGWRPFAVVASGFVAAFLVGFLVLPVPSGVGIREGALVAAAGTLVPVADVLAAAVVLRLAQLAAELGVIVAVAAVHRAVRVPAPSQACE